MKAIDRVRIGFRSHVHNGKDTRFWRDCWLDEIPLCNWAATEGGNNQHSENVVADYGSAEHGWKWDNIGNSIPDDLCRKLELMTVTEDASDHDETSRRS